MNFFSNLSKKRNRQYLHVKNQNKSYFTNKLFIKMRHKTNCKLISINSFYNRSILRDCIVKKRNCEIEKPVLGITLWHHEAFQVMIYGDSEGWIFQSHPHTLNNGLFSCLPLNSAFLFVSSKWCRQVKLHDDVTNITMTSLDDHVPDFQYNQLTVHM